MALAPKTVLTYPLNGTNRDFTIPFEYLARKFVQVTLVGKDRTILTLNIDYRFTQRTIITTTKPWGPADGYERIEIRRYTSATERLVDFSDGSILRAYDLNTSQIQAVHIAEEARDSAADNLALNRDGDFDGRMHKIINVLPGTNDGDAVAYQQVRGIYESAASVWRFILPGYNFPVRRDNGKPVQEGDHWMNSATEVSYVYLNGNWKAYNMDMDDLAGPSGASLVSHHSRSLAEYMDDTISAHKYIRAGASTAPGADYWGEINTALEEARLAGKDVFWPSTPAPLPVGQPLPQIHLLRHRGQGGINRNGAVFYPAGHFSLLNVLYVSPTGNSDGLTPGTPMAQQDATDSLNFRGPTVFGRWRIQYAAGTYPPNPSHLRNVMTSDYIQIRGPEANYGDPLVTIDATGTSAAYCLMSVGRTNVWYKDIRVTGAKVNSIASGITIDNGGVVWLDNIHADNCWQAGINANIIERLIVYGGKYQDNLNFGIKVYSGVTFSIGRADRRVLFARNGWEGLSIWNSYGHNDYCDFVGNAVGLTAWYNTHTTNYYNTFKDNAVNWQGAEDSSISSRDSTLTITNGGTPRFRGNARASGDEEAVRYGDQWYPRLGTFGRRAFDYDNWKQPVVARQYRVGGESAAFDLTGFAPCYELMESKFPIYSGFAAPSGMYTGHIYGDELSANSVSWVHQAGSMYYRRNGVTRMRISENSLAPIGAGAYTLGTLASPFDGVYSKTAVNIVSDERLKEDVRALEDAALDAWEEVALIQYKLIESVREKGTAARDHIGVIAQQVIASFEAHGVDPFKFGIVCCERWEPTPGRPKVYNKEGIVVQEAEPAIPGGERLNVRYTEALCLEAAMARRKVDRMQAELNELKEAVKALTTK